MLKLYTVVNGEMVPTDECLNTFPFDEIYQRDSHIAKDLAKREISYVGFLTDPTQENPFSGYPYNPDQGDYTRSIKIIENKFKNYEGWEPDALVKKAVEVRNEFFYNASPSISFYEGAVIAAKKVEKFLRDFDINERNLKSGAPIHTVKSITDGLKNTDDVLTKLDAMKKKVYEEIYDTMKTKRNRPINKFEE